MRSKPTTRPARRWRLAPALLFSLAAHPLAVVQVLAQSGSAAPGQAVPFEDPGKARPDTPPELQSNRIASLPPDTVLAEINGQAVTVRDLDRLIGFGDADTREIIRSGDSARKRLLQNYLESRAFYLQALEEGLDRDPEMQDRMELVRQQMLSTAYTSRELEKLQITEDDVREFYETNRRDFEIPESINASHILLRTEEEALEVRRQLEAGADFSELARQKSVDTTNKNNGGSMGIIFRGAMMPEFEEAAFKLKLGETSPPVRTNFGYHIIRVLEVRPRYFRPLAEVRRLVEARLRTQKQNEWLRRRKEELRAKYSVRLREELFGPASGQPPAP